MPGAGGGSKRGEHVPVAGEGSKCGKQVPGAGVGVLVRGSRCGSPAAHRCHHEPRPHSYPGSPWLTPYVSPTFPTHLAQGHVLGAGAGEQVSACRLSPVHAAFSPLVSLRLNKAGKGFPT